MGICEDWMWLGQGFMADFGDMREIEAGVLGIVEGSGLVEFENEQIV